MTDPCLSFVLGAPFWTFSWGPVSRALFFVCTAGGLVYLSCFAGVVGSLFRPAARGLGVRAANSAPGEDGSRELRRRAEAVAFAFVLLIAGVVTYGCTRNECYQFEAEGDFGLARQRCLDDGHDPAH